MLTLYWVMQKKLEKILKWKPKENLHSLIDEMIKSEYQHLNAIK